MGNSTASRKCWNFTILYMFGCLWIRASIMSLKVIQLSGLPSNFGIWIFGIFNEDCVQRYGCLPWTDSLPSELRRSSFSSRLNVLINFATANWYKVSTLSTSENIRSSSVLCLIQFLKKKNCWQRYQPFSFLPYNFELILVTLLYHFHRTLIDDQTNHCVSSWCL